MKFYFILLSSLLFYTNSYTQIEFEEKIIFDDSYSADGARNVRAADMDGDGFLDAISASTIDNKIAWYRNLDGLGDFGTQQIISTNASHVTSIDIADLDGDGDLDILSTEHFASNITWYENIDGLGNFGEKQIISDIAYGSPSVIASDLDNDGDLDVLFASPGSDSVIWLENMDGLGNFSPEIIINDNDNSVRAVIAIDIDGDDDLDIVSGSSYEIVWYKNLNGQGSFGEPQLISNEVNTCVDLFAIDLDEDGDNDLLSASSGDDKIAWYENIDGQGNFGPQIIISTNINDLYSVFAFDTDGDGDLDVLSASSQDHKITSYRRLSSGNYGVQQIIAYGAGARDAIAADMDGDGDMDVLSALFDEDKIEWYKNDSNGFFGPQQTITLTINRPYSVYASDIDGDNDLDVLAASREDDTVAWYENNGEDDFLIFHSINTEANGARFVRTADFDGDGDNDVLICSRSDAELIWQENLDGLGNFGPNQLIDSNVTDKEAYAVDLDGDGDLDIIATLEELQDKIVWYENTDGLGNFSEEKVISFYFEDLEAISTADIDNDGDLDVVSVSSDDNKIAWYENINNQDEFGTQQIISTDFDNPRGVVTGDLNGDGYIDVISNAYIDGQIVWFKNIDGQGNFISQPLLSNDALYVESLFAIDIDGDDDIDIISGSPSNDELALYINNDGLGNFDVKQVISTDLEAVRSIYAIDMDYDGDIDILTASNHKISWFNNQTILNINDHSVNLFLLHPNPTNDIINIENVNNLEISSIKVYNILGKLILTEEKQFNQLDVSILERGLFLFNIETNEGVISKKIIKN